MAASAVVNNKETLQYIFSVSVNRSERFTQCFTGTCYDPYLAASINAVLTTFTGSIIPAFTMCRYVPVYAKENEHVFVQKYESIAAN